MRGGLLVNLQQQMRHLTWPWVSGHHPRAAQEARASYEPRFLGLQASLLRAQRRLPEASRLLDRALEADTSRAEWPYLLIAKAKVLGEIGDLEGGITTLQHALPLLDAAGEPRLGYNVLHNLADSLSLTDRFEEAAALLPEVKALARDNAGDLDRLRLAWVEGRIAAGLGDVERGVSLLDRVRRSFAERGIGYDTALVSLELATLYLREGRTAEVKALARHMVPIFKANDIHREALAALGLFRQAAEQERATAELAAQVATYLRKARHDPALRFERG